MAGMCPGRKHADNKQGQEPEYIPAQDDDKLAIPATEEETFMKKLVRRKRKALLSIIDKGENADEYIDEDIGIGEDEEPAPIFELTNPHGNQERTFTANNAHYALPEKGKTHKMSWANPAIKKDSPITNIISTIQLYINEGYEKGIFKRNNAAWFLALRLVNIIFWEKSLNLAAYIHNGSQPPKDLNVLREFYGYKQYLLQPVLDIVNEITASTFKLETDRNGNINITSIEPIDPAKYRNKEIKFYGEKTYSTARRRKEIINMPWEEFAGGGLKNKKRVVVAVKSKGAKNLGKLFSQLRAQASGYIALALEKPFFKDLLSGKGKIEASFEKWQGGKSWIINSIKVTGENDEILVKAIYQKSETYRTELITIPKKKRIDKTLPTVGDAFKNMFSGNIVNVLRTPPFTGIPDWKTILSKDGLGYKLTIHGGKSRTTLVDLVVKKDGAKILDIRVDPSSRNSIKIMITEENGAKKTFKYQMNPQTDGFVVKLLGKGNDDTTIGHAYRNQDGEWISIPLKERQGIKSKDKNKLL